MWPPKDRNDWLALVFSAIAAAALIAGFLAVGSPGKARAQRIDEQRRTAVQETAAGLSCYHRTLGALPQDLSQAGALIEANTNALQAAPNCWSAAWRTDPETGEAFALSWFGPDKVRLCAQFSAGGDVSRRDATVMPGGMVFAVAEGLPDASGRQCFLVDLKKVPQ
jgi:hypothetical protein